MLVAGGWRAARFIALGARGLLLLRRALGTLLLRAVLLRITRRAVALATFTLSAFAGRSIAARTTVAVTSGALGTVLSTLALTLRSTSVVLTRATITVAAVVALRSGGLGTVL